MTLDSQSEDRGREQLSTDHGSEPTADGRYRVLSNGSVFDTEAKRIVKGAPMTSDQARDLAMRKHAAYRDAAEQGIMRATQQGSPPEAYGYIVQRLAETAKDRAHKQHVQAVRLVHDIILAGEEQEQSDTGVTIRASREVVQDLLQAVADARALRDSQA